METEAIREKFGDDYVADEGTFIMGIDQRFTAHFAERFQDLNVLETCTGAGFTTIPLARVAKQVTTVEINQDHRNQALKNVTKAGLSDHVTFLSGNILDEGLLAGLPPIDAAFIDPDWAVTGPNHIYRFINSNTCPPADALLERVFRITGNVAVVLPPFLDTKEFSELPEYECERLYLGDSHELYCLYFGTMALSPGETQFRVSL